MSIVYPLDSSDCFHSLRKTKINPSLYHSVVTYLYLLITKLAFNCWSRISVCIQMLVLCRVEINLPIFFKKLIFIYELRRKAYNILTYYSIVNFSSRPMQLVIARTIDKKEVFHKLIVLKHGRYTLFALV